MAFNNPYGNFTPQANPYGGQNPYLQQNIDQSLGDVTRAYNLNVKPQQARANVMSGSFGNSGLAEQQSEQQRQLAQELGRVSSGMRMQDYTQQQQLADSAANRDLQAQQASAQANLGFGQLDLGRQQMNNQYTLGQRGLDLQGQQQNDNFYTAQRGQDLQQTQLGANLTSTANAGYLSQGQGLYNLGQTQQQAPWSVMGSMGSTIQPFTGYGTTTATQNGSQLGGMLGGALGAAQLGNLFGGSSSGSSNLGFGGYSPTTNYSAGANYNLW